MVITFNTANNNNFIQLLLFNINIYDVKNA